MYTRALVVRPCNAVAGVCAKLCTAESDTGNVTDCYSRLV